jgi:hypothetical protein
MIHQRHLGFRDCPMSIAIPRLAGWCARAASARALLAAPLLLLAVAASPHAEPLLSAPFLSYDVGSIPYSVCVADFNADLKPDLAVANAGSHTVSVLLGNGDGTFGTGTDFATGSWPRSVAAADLNRDGRPDLAVANQGSNTVSVLLGNGDGTFGIRTDFEVGSDPWSVAIGDLDGDRRPDLAVANSAQSDPTGSVSVLLGNGDGTFEARTDLGVGNHPWAVAIGDLDSDRRADLVVANQGSNTLSVLLGNGDGSFDAGADIRAGVDPLSVAIADLDGDGRPDLVVANSGLFHSNQPGTVSVLLGNGHGTFGGRTDYGTGLNPWSVAVADFDGDGRRDLVVANQDPNTVSVFLGDGDGTFRDKLDSGTGSEPLSVAVADLDLDGRPDVATANARSNNVAALHGNGDGTFGSRTNFATGSYPTRVVTGDFNDDGRPDMAVSNYWGNSVSVLLGNGDGTFADRTDFDLGGRPGSLAIADLDRDGRLDLALTSSRFVGYENVGRISVMFGNGDGTFGALTDIGTGRFGLVAVADLNADGSPDLVMVKDGSYASVFLGNGDGTFRPRRDYLIGPDSAFPAQLVIADLNLDGRPDLVIPCGHPSYTVRVMFGNGDGTFPQWASAFRTPSPSSVAVADLNADGRPDMAVTNGISQSVSVMLGNGSGWQWSTTEFATGINPTSVAIADLDADGRLDLAMANAGSNTVSVLLGNGDGTFAARTDYGIGKVPVSLAIDDFNGDGRRDLAVVSGYGNTNTVVVLLNRGGAAAPLSMEFEVTPGTLNLSSGGRWVTGYLEPASPLARVIDVSSIRLNGTVPADAAAPAALCDHDGDGVPDLMVKFNRVAVELTMPEGDNVPVTVTGMVDGQSFSGTDFIRVRRGKISAPFAGSQLAGGSVAQARWEAPQGVTVESVALLFSRDGGATWRPLTRGLPATGSCDWTVPNVPTDQAKLAVLVESGGDSGAIVEGVLGVSETFAIGTVVGVGDRGAGEVALAIGGVTPNPAVGGRLRVEFALRDGSPARLELLDVAGRALVSKQVGAMGPGRHSLDLAGGRAAPPGIYFLRLSQGGSEARARVAVLR